MKIDENDKNDEVLIKVIKLYERVHKFRFGELLETG